MLCIMLLLMVRLTIQENHKSKVNAVGMRYLRNVCGKTHMDRISNEWVLGLKGNPDASTLRNKTQQLVNLVATVPNTNGSNPLLPTSRIANGEFAYRDQFPHHALIIIDNYGTCGGSLIDVSYILTTAYCTLQGSTFYVALGLTDMDTADSDVVTLISRTAIIHESYNSADFSNNIAIIKLHDSVTLSFFVRLVSLPSFSDSDNTFEGQDVQVSGWGETCVCG
ncbi:unnamed protein product [Timema podura]|uniref:Peptidase S1 domain-containing protein n=1 Tax=Timema podura TaxID=61482 RepID=A0ABN7P4S5_TIMPD|nr:unnamed protein product [Timema podura]